MRLWAATLLSLLLLLLIIAEAYGELEVTESQCQYPTENVYMERAHGSLSQCDGNTCEQDEVSAHAKVCISVKHKLKYSIILGKHPSIPNWVRGSDGGT